MKLGYKNEEKREATDATTVIDISSRFERNILEWEEEIDGYWRLERWIVVESVYPNEESDVYFITKEGQRMKDELRALREAKRLPPGELDTLDWFLEREERQRRSPSPPRRIRIYR